MWLQDEVRDRRDETRENKIKEKIRFRCHYCHQHHHYYQHVHHQYRHRLENEYSISVNYCISFNCTTIISINAAMRGENHSHYHSQSNCQSNNRNHNYSQRIAVSTYAVMGSHIHNQCNHSKSVCHNHFK
jgi:hypothetical protein